MQPTLRFRLLAGALAILLPFLASASETVPGVQTRTESFRDVTLVSQTESHVFLKHARGVANVRIADLDNETLVALGVKGFQVAVKGAGTVATGGQGAGQALLPALSGLGQEWRGRLPEAGAIPLPSREVLFVAGGVLLASWLFFCWCAKLLCAKAGQPPGFLIWLPVLQLLPLLRAAGMSGWWLAGFFVPGLNIVAFVLWSLNIARARGKGVLTGILLIFPITNLFAFLYLAFSGPGEAAEPTPPARPVFRMEPLPSQ